VINPEHEQLSRQGNRALLPRFACHALGSSCFPRIVPGAA